MKIEATDYWARDSRTPLACPLCDGPNLHNEGVRVRDRRQEDGPGIDVRVTAGNASVQEARTFAGRRDDTEVAFSCEECGGFFALGFVQHKGTTLVDVTPGRPDWLGTEQDGGKP